MRRALLTTVAAVSLVAACSTPTQNFQEQTESFLNDSASVSAQFDDADVSNAACERPDDTAIGTNYSCTADVAGTGVVAFRVQITGENSFAVIDYGN